MTPADLWDWRPLDSRRFARNYPSMNINDIGASDKPGRRGRTTSLAVRPHPR